MKERPILFSGTMVRAILEGRKTVTRRPLRGALDPEHLADTMTKSQWQRVNRELPAAFGAAYFCPLGQPGDRLWVRETYADIGCRLTYRADADDGAHCQVKKWTPAIHMFRKDSRILLEITAVRVERLQDISLQQARAEGCEVREFWLFGADAEERQRIGARAFERLWTSINGVESWAANPWVWVVEFKRVTP